MVWVPVPFFSSFTSNPFPGLLDCLILDVGALEVLLGLGEVEEVCWGQVWAVGGVGHEPDTPLEEEFLTSPRGVHWGMQKQLFPRMFPLENFQELKALSS